MKIELNSLKKLLDAIVDEKKATAERLVGQYRPYAEFLLQPRTEGRVMRTCEFAERYRPVGEVRPHDGDLDHFPPAQFKPLFDSLGKDSAELA